MKNYIADGDLVPIASAPYALTGGQGALVGALFGIAQTDAAVSTAVVLATEGIYDVTKEPSLAISQGARVFWDNTNKRITTTTTSNFAVGIATVAALAADTTVRVRLGRTTPAGT